MVHRLHDNQVVRFLRKQRETPEEARQRRLCRLMLGLPPETVYHHVREGVITVAGLGLVLVVMIAWRMGQLATLAPILFSGALLAMLTPTVLMVRRRYRHVLAAVLVLAMLLGLSRGGRPSIRLSGDVRARRRSDSIGESPTPSPRADPAV